jgi:hypothetical protein
MDVRGIFNDVLTASGEEEQGEEEERCGGFHK